MFRSYDQDLCLLQRLEDIQSFIWSKSEFSSCNWIIFVHHCCRHAHRTPHRLHFSFLLLCFLLCVINLCVFRAAQHWVVEITLRLCQVDLCLSMGGCGFHWCWSWFIQELSLGFNLLTVKATPQHKMDVLYVMQYPLQKCCDREQENSFIKSGTVRIMWLFRPTLRFGSTKTAWLRSKKTGGRS